jgi:cysteinyl-tRNA synthetase
MTLRLTNTLSHRKETLKPIQPGEIGIYTCGPTVYDTAHIGNMRTFMFEDLLKRYLQFKGYQVKHIMNITDVDDRTIRRAIDEDKRLSELTEQYTKLFLADISALNILPADNLPAATEFIPQMVEGIAVLLEKGHAYRTDDGSIFFDVSSYKEYGKLARLDPEQTRVGERVADDNYEKEEARDFALWKARKPEDDEYAWPSPWGEGRPGWHMECSTMSMHYLGEHFDIHCGGVDNIFPHHENEIAQSRCMTGKPFVNVWLHSEHLIVDGQKMSKSLDNYYTLGDILKQGHSPEAVRYTLLATHYRQKLNFTFEKVDESQKAINRLRELIRRLEAVHETQKGIDVESPLPEIESALDDDLNVSGALGAMFSWAKDLFVALDSDQISYDAALASLETLRRLDEIFGVIFFSQERDDKAAIEALVKEREAARSVGDWKRADAIRDELRARGIILEDTDSGTIWMEG